MKAKDMIGKAFEDYYNSDDCGMNKIFVTKELIRNIYMRAYVDGFQNAANSLKVKK